MLTVTTLPHTRQPRRSIQKELFAVVREDRIAEAGADRLLREKIRAELKS